MRDRSGEGESIKKVECLSIWFGCWWIYIEEYHGGGCAWTRIWNLHNYESSVAISETSQFFGDDYFPILLGRRSVQKQAL